MVCSADEEGVWAQVNLNLESKAANTRKARNKVGTGANYSKVKKGFSAANPYGRQQPGDNRQFIRT